MWELEKGGSWEMGLWAGWFACEAWARRQGVALSRNWLALGGVVSLRSASAQIPEHQEYRK